MYEKVANTIKNASSLFVCSGAGMGVDSGLPDFRGDKGFWNAYPHYAKLGVSFSEMADPIHFNKNPSFAWGFYGHRLELYRKTKPHKGYTLLQDWAKKYKLPLFSITSNVDGHFKTAGFSEESIWEIHGSIHHLQCSKPCSDTIWKNKQNYNIDFTSMKADNISYCPKCGSVARPNILMFGDFSFIGKREEQQEKNYTKFKREKIGRNPVVIEIGAGTALPSIRHIAKSIVSGNGGTIIRINIRESEIENPHIAIDKGAKETLEKIDVFLTR